MTKRRLSRVGGGASNSTYLSDSATNATLGAPATVAARVWHAAARLVLRKARVAPVRSRLDGGRQAEHRDEEHCQLHCVDTAVSAHGRAGRCTRVCLLCVVRVSSVCGANLQCVASWGAVFADERQACCSCLSKRCAGGKQAAARLANARASPRKGSESAERAAGAYACRDKWWWCWW